MTQRRGKRLLRALGLALYSALVVTIVVYETSANAVLREGIRLQQQETYRSAEFAHRIVLEKYPLSIAVTRAREQLQALRPEAVPQFEANRLRRTLVEEALTRDYSPYEINQFPIAALALCTLLFGFVFATRIRHRFRLGMLSLILTGTTALATAFVAGNEGMMSFKIANEIRAVIDGFPDGEQLVHVSSWIGLGIAGMFMLSGLRRSTASECARRPRQRSAPFSGAA